MADNRTKQQIIADHHQHVHVKGVSSFSAYMDVPLIVEGEQLGSTVIQVCEECPYIKVECNHENNSWNEKGTTLTCNLCGMDVT